MESTSWITKNKSVLHSLLAVKKIIELYVYSNKFSSKTKKSSNSSIGIEVCTQKRGGCVSCYGIKVIGKGIWTKFIEDNGLRTVGAYILNLNAASGYETNCVKLADHTNLTVMLIRLDNKADIISYKLEMDGVKEIKAVETFEKNSSEQNCVTFSFQMEFSEKDASHMELMIHQYCCRLQVFFPEVKWYFKQKSDYRICYGTERVMSIGAYTMDVTSVTTNSFPRLNTSNDNPTVLLSRMELKVACRTLMKNNLLHKIYADLITIGYASKMGNQQEISVIIYIYGPGRIPLCFSQSVSALANLFTSMICQGSEEFYMMVENNDTAKNDGTIEIKLMFPQNSKDSNNCIYSVLMFLLLDFESQSLYSIEISNTIEWINDNLEDILQKNSDQIGAHLIRHLKTLLNGKRDQQLESIDQSIKIASSALASIVRNSTDENFIKLCTILLGVETPNEIQETVSKCLHDISKSCFKYNRCMESQGKEINFNGHSSERKRKIEDIDDNLLSNEVSDRQDDFNFLATTDL